MTYESSIYQSSAESRLSTPAGRTQPTMAVMRETSKKAAADSPAALTTAISTMTGQQW